METILVVGNDPDLPKLLAAFLPAKDYVIESAGSLEGGMAAAGRCNFHLLVSSLQGQEGATLLRWFAAHAPETPCLLAVEPEANRTALEAASLGAAGCIARTDGAGEDIRTIVRAVLDNSSAAAERELLRDSERARAALDALVARDLTMLQTLESAAGLARLQAPVLLRGETGSGRETLARYMHACGPRAGRPFAVVECDGPAAAVAEQLFGREGASSPGGAPGRIGSARRAHLGTLYLDEVGALDGALQQHVLRLLDEGFCEPAGGSRRIRVDICCVASTARDLEHLVAQGRFREDLYERLSAHSLAVPPLRERRADIPALARLFLSRAAHRLHRPEILLAHGAEKSLQLHDWPGNVWELANVMERTALVCGSQVQAGDLPIGPPPAHERPLLWKEIERQAIEDALRRNGGNRTRAARQLGISLRTLQYRLKEWSAADV